MNLRKRSQPDDIDVTSPWSVLVNSDMAPFKSAHIPCIVSAEKKEVRKMTLGIKFGDRLETFSRSSK